MQKEASGMLEEPAARDNSEEVKLGPPGRTQLEGEEWTGEIVIIGDFWFFNFNAPGHTLATLNF